METATMASQQRQGRTAKWFVLCVLLGFGVLILRFWIIQVTDGERYHRASTQNIVRRTQVSPPRGRIYDRRGVLLAGNRPAFDVFWDPEVYRRSGSADDIQALQEHLMLSAREVERLRARLKQSKAPIRVRRDITRVQVAAIASRLVHLPGVDLVAGSRRTYPLHDVGAHLVGFVGEVGSKQLASFEDYGYRMGDRVGKMGAEASFEPILRGSPGFEQTVVDARGFPQSEEMASLLLGSRRSIRPIPGRDIVLSIDAALQIVAAEALKRYPSGSAVALDPRDGSVLAMVSHPSFDPEVWSGRLSAKEKNELDNDPFTPMLDKSVASFFPGSVYKLVGAYAGLDQGVVTSADETDCSGQHYYGGRKFRCWKWGGHGEVDLAGALQKSCDVYFYLLAETLGIDRLSDYARRLGFGEATGFPINNESAGRVPTREWHENQSPNGYQGGFALNTVLGQGDTLVSPLQVALAYATVANGGNLLMPRIVDEVRSAAGKTIFTYPREVRRQVDWSPEHLAEIKRGFLAAVAEEDGTAFEARRPHLSVAGKTGTAQVHRIGRRRRGNKEKVYKLRDHAWFVGYAPVDDPQIVLVVLLEHGGHGGSDAAPVAMEILDSYFSPVYRERLSRRLRPQTNEGLQ